MWFFCNKMINIKRGLDPKKKNISAEEKLTYDEANPKGDINKKVET